MKTNQLAINLIKIYEGCSLTAYRDIAKVWTIGYGHTGHDVFEGQKISQDRADELLEQDIEHFEKNVERVIGEFPTTENQFGAMVSLAYNIGIGAFKTSSVLRAHKEGDYKAAAAAFNLWTQAGGKKRLGLVRRRKAESALYEKGGQ